jgi:hypothetical protein
MLNSKRYAPMNARDKMPFEVTPVFFRLTHYDAPEAAQQAAGTPASTPAVDTQGTAAQASTSGPNPQ